MYKSLKILIILTIVIIVLLTCQIIGGTSQPENLSGVDNTQPGPKDFFPGPDSAPPDMGQAFLSMLGSLFIILFLIICSIFLVKKFKSMGIINRPTGGLIHILDIKPLGDRQKIGVIEVADHVLVIGLHEGGMELLKEFKNQDFPLDKGILVNSKSQTGSGPGPGFSKLLSSIMQKVSFEHAGTQADETQ